MKLRTKFILSLVAFLAFLAIGALLSRHTMIAVQGQVEHLTTITLPLNTLLGEIRALGYRMYSKALSAALERAAARSERADDDHHAEKSGAEDVHHDHEEDAKKDAAQFARTKAQMQDLLREYVAKAEADEHEIVGELQVAVEKLTQSAEFFVGKNADADHTNQKTVEDALTDAEHSFEAAITQAIEREQGEVREAGARTTQAVLWAGKMSLCVIGVTLGFVTLLVVFFMQVVARPLAYLTKAAEEIGKGNFTTQIAIHSTDEIGVLASTFTHMQSQLQRKTQENEQQTVELRQQAAVVANEVKTLRVATTNITTAVSQVMIALNETAVSITQTAQTVEEVKQTAYVSSRKAQEVSDSSQKTAQISQGGKHAVDQTMIGMSHVQQQMESIAQSVLRLSEQNQAIGNIMAAVNDIAEQSNLLAVNAAIEAAKAGEVGRGFTIVAQEVKRLAEQSKQSTLQVRTILTDIQKAMQTAVLVTEQGTRSAEVGAKQAIEAGASIETLTQSVIDASQAVTQIAVSSQQQVVGMDQVAGAIENIKKAAAHNLEGIRQIETAAKNLQQVGFSLHELVARTST